MNYLKLNHGMNYYTVTTSNKLEVTKILDFNKDRIIVKSNNKHVTINSYDFKNNWMAIRDLINKNLTKKQLNEIYGGDIPDYYGHNWVKSDVIGSITNLFFECKESQLKIIEILENKGVIITEPIEIKKDNSKMNNLKYIAYKPMTKKDRFNNAVNMIESFLTDYNSPYKFKLVDQTTNNFETFKNEVKINGYMLVSNEGNEKTIYTKPYYNTIARVWHDTVHLNTDLNFSLEDETIVAYFQIAELEEYGDNNGYNRTTVEDAKELIYHDIIGQANYYKKTNSFVDDQKKFVYSKFLNKGGN